MQTLEESLVMSEAVQDLWLERGRRAYDRLLELTKSTFHPGAIVSKKKKEDFLHSLHLMGKDIEDDILHGEKCLDFYQGILQNENVKFDNELRDRVEALKNRNQSRLISFNERAYECLDCCFDIVMEHGS